MERIEKPLAGKRIVVTRAPEQAQGLMQRLRELGADVLLLPTVCFAPPKDWNALDAALKDIASFDWVLFTSANSVRYFCQRMRESNVPREAVKSAGCRIAAVGRTTAEVLAAEALQAHYVGKDQTGEALARELRGDLNGKKILLPRSDRADERLPNALRDIGATVTEVVVYRTATPEDIDRVMLEHVRRGEADAIVFSSPSAFHNLRDLLDAEEMVRISRNMGMAAIGPTTARALRDSGVVVEIEAGEASSEGIASAIAEYFQRKTLPARLA